MAFRWRPNWWFQALSQWIAICVTYSGPLVPTRQAPLSVTTSPLLPYLHLQCFFFFGQTARTPFCVDGPGWTMWASAWRVFGGGGFTTETKQINGSFSSSSSPHKSESCREYPPHVVSQNRIGLVLTRGVPIIFATSKIWFMWNQETPHDYHGFIVHIHTPIAYFKSPNRCGRRNGPQHKSIFCVLMASSLADSANAN